MKNIPYLDLYRQYVVIEDEIDIAIKRVLNNQSFILGQELEAFESTLANYLDVKYVVGVGSGTDGLVLAFMALGIGKGDEVITPVNSFIATTLAITEVGATPIFTDVDPQTYQMSINDLSSKITKRTKAILPVHLYGAPSDITSIINIALKNDLHVVEDACQAHGATVNGKKVGTYGSMGVFSFYPGKNLGAYGDGGAICTNNEQIYNILRKLRNYGQTKKYFHDDIGKNSRLDEIQAAVLTVKLKHLSNWNRKRNAKANHYRKLLEDIKTQFVPRDDYSVYHIFTVEHERRDELKMYLAGQGIQTQIHYPVPIHLQKCYRYLGHKKGDFPIAEGVAGRILSLPIYPELKNVEVEYIAKEINHFHSHL